MDPWQLAHIAWFGLALLIGGAKEVKERIFDRSPAVVRAVEPDLTPFPEVPDRDVAECGVERE